jgi:hypothetical protein
VVAGWRVRDFEFMWKDPFTEPSFPRCPFGTLPGKVGPPNSLIHMVGQVDPCSSSHSWCLPWHATATAFFLAPVVRCVTLGGDETVMTLGGDGTVMTLGGDGTVMTLGVMGPLYDPWR